MNIVPQNSDFDTRDSILDYQKLDARWFDNRPNRRFRLRNPYVGEPFGPPGKAPPPPAPPPNKHYVLVMKLAPGIHIRRSFTAWVPRQLDEDYLLRNIAEGLGMIDEALEMALGMINKEVRP